MKGLTVIMRDSEKTVGGIIDKSSTAQICYCDPDGYPITKAMLPPREREGIRTFYFTTNTSSLKIKCFRENPKASIYFVDRRFFRGVSLIGTVEILESEDIKRRIWRDGDTQYYPQGVNDPDYCVIRFTALKGRYYSNFKSEDFAVIS